MSGIHEILLLLLIIAIIFILPRMKKKEPFPQPVRSSQIRPRFILTVKIRLAIVVTILWIFVSALYFQPWAKDLRLFLTIGMGPVVILWAMVWVIQGLKRQKRV